jgi:hypothetical protein
MPKIPKIRKIPKNPKKLKKSQKNEKSQKITKILNFFFRSYFEFYPKFGCFSKSLQRSLERTFSDQKMGKLKIMFVFSHFLGKKGNINYFVNFSANFARKFLKMTESRDIY